MRAANDNSAPANAGALRFLSVCSGIEAASVAWPQWQAVAWAAHRQAHASRRNSSKRQQQGHHHCRRSLTSNPLQQVKHHVEPVRYRAVSGLPAAHGPGFDADASRKRSLPFVPV